MSKKNPEHWDVFLELTKTSRMPEVTFHYWFFGRFIIFCCRNAVFFSFLLNFGLLLFSHLIHHWRFQRVALNPTNLKISFSNENPSLVKKKKSDTSESQADYWWDFPKYFPGILGHYWACSSDILNHQPIYPEFWNIFNSVTLHRLVSLGHLESFWWCVCGSKSCSNFLPFSY